MLTGSLGTGLTYDVFGRTTELPGSTIGSYANDLAHRQTTGEQRQTWQLDAALRFRSWTVESGSGDAWTRTAGKLNHDDSDSDNPRWIVEDTGTGALSRNVEAASGDLAATTSATGDTVLRLTTVHGDVALQLPLDTDTAPSPWTATSTETLARARRAPAAADSVPSSAPRRR